MNDNEIELLRENALLRLRLKQAEESVAKHIQLQEKLVELVRGTAICAENLIEEEG